MAPPFLLTPFVLLKKTVFVTVNGSKAALVIAFPVVTSFLLEVKLASFTVKSHEDV